MFKHERTARGEATSTWRMSIVVGGLLLAVGASGPAQAAGAQTDALRKVLQGRGGSSGNPACSVLTVAEIKALTGFQGYNSPSPGDPPGEGAGGGASCQYQAPGVVADEKGNAVRGARGPLLSLVLVDGKNYTQTVPIGRGCKKETVAGVGDAAFFEVCPAAKVFRTPPLYVKAGTKDLVLQMDVESPDTDAALRPKIIALAKAAAAKLK